MKETNDARSLLASITPRETSRSGIYEMCFNRVDGAGEADRFAVNVDASEGNLAQTPTRDIVTKLDPVSTDIGYADQYETAAIEQSGFNQSLLLMCLLIVLLLGEQILAYVTSYHPSRRSAASADAGRGLSDASPASATRRTRAGRLPPAAHRIGHVVPMNRFPQSHPRRLGREEYEVDTCLVLAG